MKPQESLKPLLQDCNGGTLFNYLVLRKVLHIEQTNTVSLWASGAVAPILDLNTLYEQQREQKLTPQLLQFLLFFKTENAELQWKQLPVEGQRENMVLKKIWMAK